MILQSLITYYDRCSDKLAAPGWILKPVDFAVVIDRDGAFVTVTDLREEQGGKSSGKPALLPNIGTQSQKHNNSGKDANLLWDDALYILGMKSKGAITTEAFCQTVFQFFPGDGEFDSSGLQAIRLFCKNHLDKEMVRANIADLLPSKNGELLPVILAFRMDGDTEGYFISDCIAVKNRVASFYQSKKNDGICAVTGVHAPISRNHTVLKNVWGGQSSGVALVSFNATSFTSYNKEGGYNAPVGEKAMFKYTTALNTLLSGDSRQRMQVGDASTVFWSDKSNHLEDTFSSYFSEPPKDDPDRNVYAVRSLYESFEKGKRHEDDSNTRFFVLGLSPNAARASVRFWIVGTVSEMEGNILRHFEDIRIAHGPKDKDELSLFRLLIQTATQGKAENILPGLAGETIQSILRGTPYPANILSSLLRRIRAERSLPHARAAFLKACLNRSRLVEDTDEKELQVSLDLTNTNIGYRLGRLFAALEKTQQDALPGINATIRDRFYGSASSTPAAVFPTLIRNSKHHLAKMENGRISREKLFGEIMDAIVDFPPVLTLGDQGRFAIGYYHQMQSFFTPRERIESNQ